MSRYAPRVVPSTREQETMLSYYRVKRGFTVQALADAVGVPKPVIVELASGLRAPIYLAKSRAGAIRREVLELEVVLGVSAAELFPAYICGVDTRELPDDVLSEFTVGGWSSVAARSDNAEMFERCTETKRAVWTALRCLTGRQKRIVLRRTVSEESLKTVAKTEDISVERVRQIEKVALRRLRSRFRKITTELQGIK